MNVPLMTVHVRRVAGDAERPWAAYRHGGANWSGRGRNPAEAIGQLMLEMDAVGEPPADVIFDNGRPDEPGTMTVRVADRAAMDRQWGRPGLLTAVVRTVTIAAVCPVCGGPRGTPTPQDRCEDGDPFTVDTWVNPCGHVDRYADVLAEGGAS